MIAVAVSCRCGLSIVARYVVAVAAIFCCVLLQFMVLLLAVAVVAVFAVVAVGWCCYMIATAGYNAAQV